MAINYDKLLALKIPDVEHTYTDKDTILYALGVGLGHDPLDLKQLDFVYEKNLKALPTFAAMLGYPGFWVRDLDTGIDWVRIVNGEQAVLLHQPLKPTGTVLGKSRVLEVIDKGQGKGALVYAERKVTDKASGALIATVDADHVLPRRRRLRRAAAREPAGAQDSRARAGSRVRSRHPAGAGDDLPAVRRPQSAAHRPGDGQDRGLSASRSCTGSAPSASSATRCSRACATMTRRAWRRSAGASRRRCFPARPSAPRCGATAMS